jgi:AMP deaminase
MKTVHVEMRLSIYGNSESNWSDLAQWACRWDVYSPSNRWMIQTPRIYRIFRKIGKVSSFQQYLDNIFAPLFAVTIDPAVNPDLDRFLQEVSGFDSVDDESVAEPSLISVSPEEVRVSRPVAVLAKSLTFVWCCVQWTSAENPPYAYQLFYFHANLVQLNALRRAKGLNTFDMRPHSGESGSVHHLTCTYLLAEGINHGVNLKNNIALQYLYYLDQVGLAVSPVSNSFLFMNIHQNPFPKFFKRGLNVSLSTDDPVSERA